MTTDPAPALEWRWRFQWGGRWVTDKLWRTEDEIRREHPEAVRVDGSERVRVAPVPITGSMYKPAAEMDPQIAEAWRGRTPGNPPKG